MTQLPVKPGIDGLPTGLIPSDPAAFVDWFKNSFLPRWAANADARNAIPTSASVLITGSLDTPAGIGIGANSITNSELVQRSPLSVMGNPTGAEANVQDIAAPADGYSLQRIAGALVWAPTSATVNVADSITGLGTLASPLELVGDALAPGNSEYYGTNVSGTKGFFPLPSTKQVFIPAGGLSQTYNVPANVTFVQVICIAGGGGGGGGGKVGGLGSNSGGGGGGAGGVSIWTFLASDLGASQTIAFTTTTGSVGGAGATTAASGSNGTAGSDAQFGSLLVAYHGNGGGGGNTSAPGTAGAGGVGLFSTGTAGGQGGATGGGAAGNTGVNQTTGASFIGGAYACTGGGGGVGSSNTSTATAGKGGGFSASLPISQLLGGTGGGPATPGGNGNGVTGIATGGGGGGGGGGAVNGANGGNAGGFGGGGGGAGSTETGTTGGKGGDGGTAAVIIIAW